MSEKSRLSKRSLETRAISKLRPYKRNARTHSESQITQLMASIKEFGWTNPVLIDDKGGIVAGHARLEAAKRLGYTEAPTIRLSGLTQAQLRAYVIADNKLALNADWDEELLRLELTDLKALDFDLNLVGFDDGELEKLLVVAPEKPEPIAIQRSADLTSLAPDDEEKKILEGRTLLVEFSGGKDSSAVAIWTKHYFPKAKIFLHYVDLGAEWDGFFLHLRRFSEAIGCELKILRAKQNIIDAFLLKGKWPGFVGPYCQEILHGALDEALMSYPATSVACVRGGRVQEKARRSKAGDSRFLVIKRLKDYVFFQPLYFATKAVAEKIVLDNDLPIWEGYDSGLMRSACRICPGQRPGTYAAIRANHPRVWEELLELERRLGPGAWRKTEPGAGVKTTFEELADKGEASFLEYLSRKSTRCDAGAAVAPSCRSADRTRARTEAHKTF
jgi:3'-phosphoadenosine 5'-phosphosulfate sulfotransferase (PAPS reductase)/FAD synthetase